MLTLGAISFAVPWALSALLALPVIWWLLRLTPPLPTTIRFPAVRLLFGLGTPEEMARAAVFLASDTELGTRDLVLAGRPDASTRGMERVVMATYTLAQVLLGLGCRRLEGPPQAQAPTAR